MISLGAMISLGTSLVFIMFIGENKCVCLIYILILVVDSLRAIRLALNKKSKKRVEVKEYLIGLKWISFIVFSLIICGSFFYNIVRLWSRSAKFGINTEDWGVVLKWMDYILLFYEKSNIVPRSVSEM